MVPSGDFAFDHRRVTGALALEPAHFSEFQRLAKTVRFGPGFQFLILEFNDVAYRTQLAAAIDDFLTVEGFSSRRMDLVERGFTDVAGFESAIRSLDGAAAAVHVFGGEAWFGGPHGDARVEAFNIRREAFSQIGPIKMMLWLTTDLVAKIAKQAPDLWAWRGSVVFSFVRATHFETPRSSSGMRAIDTRTLAELDGNNWFYFNYSRGLMQAISSNENFNTIIKELKSDKRELKTGKGEAAYQFNLSTVRKKADFLKKTENIIQQ